MERQAGSGGRRGTRLVQSIKAKAVTPGATSQQARYFPALTGIRAIAAWMVFLHHYKPFENTNSTLLKNLTGEMHVGVTLFFVLSGFLIAFRYMDNQTLNFRNYMVNRFAKIFPVYALLTSITILVYGYGNTSITLKDELFVFFMNVSFLKGFFEDLVFTGIAQGWSLTIEECFYILAPLLFLLLRKSLHFIYLMPFLFIVLGLILMDLAKDGAPYGFMRSKDFVLNMTFFGRCSEFFVGMALAIIVKRQLFNNLPKILTGAGFLIVLYSIYMISSFKVAPATSGMYTPQGKLINHLFMPIFGIAVLYLGLLREKTLLSRMLSTPVMQALGKSSYVFYLIHIGVFSDLIGGLSNNVLFAFVTMNAIAYLIYLSVEKPLNSLLKKLFTKPTSVSA